MSKRGAIELSVNFLVIIIISITIFGFGVYFISSLSSKANDWAKMSSDDFDKKIGDLVCSGYEKVCIPADKKTIRKNDFSVFGIEIFNIGARQIFAVEASNPKMIPVGGADAIAPSVPLRLNPSGTRSVEIGQNEGRSIGIGVQVQPNSPAGTYIIDVKISDQAGIQYGGTIFKLYVEVP